MSVQISAYIQDATKEKMEKYSASHGLKKAFIIENAIEHYLQALYEMPKNVLVPGHFTVDLETYSKIKTINQNEPTLKLKELFS